MREVCKYEVPIEGRFTMNLPKTGKFLTFQAQHDQPLIWVLADPNDPRVTPREFYLAGPGQPIEQTENDLLYRGSCQIRGGAVALHLFEVIRF